MMKSSKYSNFCLKNFGRFFLEYKKDQLEEKNLDLIKANIQMSYEEYASLTLMNVILTMIISYIVIGALVALAPSTFTLTLLVFLPPLLTLCVGGIYLYLPIYFITRRGRNIDLYLPYAINFISSMAVAGISPAEIFQTLSTVSVYGEVQMEARKIAKEITIMGTDNITALKRAIEVSPSRKLKAFLQGIIGTIQSGSDLHVYLANIAQKYMEGDLVDRKKDLDLLAVIAEIMVLTVIAFPILLVIILTVMGFFGGPMDASLNILLIFSFLILPVIYIVFYLLIESTSIERLTKVEFVKEFDLVQYYKDNKGSLLVFFLSAIIVLILYGAITILGYLGTLDLNIYVYWDFAFVAFLILITPIGFYKYIELKKKKDMQNRLPDFLIEVGDALATGMNIFDAVQTAEKSHYGKLSPEIKIMKTQLSWNVSMKNVLFDFAERMKSAIVQRLVIAIDKGLIMGGNTPKIFKAAAGEVDQVNQIEHQRKSIMTVYALVILVCFFVFLGIILILNETIFSSFMDIQSQQLVNAPEVISLSVVDTNLLNYTLYSFVFVQSLGAGLLAGFMMDRKLSSGVRFSFFLGVISIIVFKILV